MKYKIDMESVKALAAEEIAIKENSGWSYVIYYNAKNGKIWGVVKGEWDELNYGDSVIKIGWTMKTRSENWYIKKLEEKLKELKWVEDELKKDGWPSEEWLSRYGIEV